MRLRTLGTVLFWVGSSALGAWIDGSALVPQETETVPARVDCFEDEAIVQIVSSFDGGAPYYFDPGEIVCAPYDDLNAGRRPYPGQ